MGIFLPYRPGITYRHQTLHQHESTLRGLYAEVYIMSLEGCSVVWYGAKHSLHSAIPHQQERADARPAADHLPRLPQQSPLSIQPCRDPSRGICIFFILCSCPIVERFAVLYKKLYTGRLRDKTIRKRKKKKKKKKKS